jgi:hypothetical protein
MNSKYRPAAICDVAGRAYHHRLSKDVLKPSLDDQQQGNDHHQQGQAQIKQPLFGKKGRRMGNGFIFFLESTDSFDFLPLPLSFKESAVGASSFMGTLSPFIGNEQVRLSPVGTLSFLHV